MLAVFVEDGSGSEYLHLYHRGLGFAPAVHRPKGQWDCAPQMCADELRRGPAKYVW